MAFVTDVGHTARIEGATVLSAVLFSAFISRAIFLRLIAGRIGRLWSLLISGVQGSMLGLFTISNNFGHCTRVRFCLAWAMGGIFPIYSVAVEIICLTTRPGGGPKLFFVWSCSYGSRWMAWWLHV